MKRDGIAASRLAHALRVDRGRTVLTDDSLSALVKADATANLAGIEDGGYLAIRFAIKQKSYFGSVDAGTVAAQIAFGQIFSCDQGMAVFVENDFRGRGKRRHALGIDELRRDHEDENKCGSNNQVGPQAFPARRPFSLSLFRLGDGWDCFRTPPAV